MIWKTYCPHNHWTINHSHALSVSIIVMMVNPKCQCLKMIQSYQNQKHFHDIKFLCSGGQVFVHSEKSNLIRRRPFHDQFIINDILNLNELFADTCNVI